MGCPRVDWKKNWGKGSNQDGGVKGVEASRKKTYSWVWEPYLPTTEASGERGRAYKNTPG